MVRINPLPEKENLNDANVFRILKAVCVAKNEEKVLELRKLLAILEGKDDSIREVSGMPFGVSGEV